MKNKWLIAGILIVILLLLFSAIIYFSRQGIEQARQSGFQWRLFSTDIISAQVDEELSFDINGPAVLDISNNAGNITVTSGTEKEIKVEVHKTAWGSNRANAETALEEIKIVSTQEGNRVTIRVESISVVNFFSISHRPDTVAFTISVPEETEIITHSDFGDVVLSGTNGDSNLHTNFGDIQAEDINGGLIADTNSGKVQVKRIQTNKGDIDLKSEFGSISLMEASAKDINVQTNSGKLTLEDIEASGMMDLESEFGEIQFISGQANSLIVEVNSGTIDLIDLTLEETLDAKTEFGNVTLTNVNAISYTLKSNSGKIKIDKAQGTVEAYSEFGDIEVTNGKQAIIDLRTNSGAVEYSGSLGSGPHFLATEFGNVQLTIPEESNLSVDLETEFGKIKSDLGITISDEFSEKRFRGIINDGGTNLTASTNSGNITILILTP